MIRGTTAQFKFKLPCQKSALEWVTVEFWQDGNDGTEEAPLPITKTLSHCPLPLDSTELCISLTANETMRFSDRIKAKLQLVAKKWDGTRFASHQQSIAVYPIRDDIITPPSSLPDDEVNEDGWISLNGGHIIPQGGDY
jgi:hypothetical protein